MNWWKDVNPEHNRTWRAGNGLRVHFQKVPGSTLWKIVWGSGETPVALRGKYMSFHSAFAAVNNELQKRKAPTELVEEVAN